MVVALGEPGGLPCRHPAPLQGRPEALDAAFAARLEAEEPHAEADRCDGDCRDQEDRKDVAVVSHQSSPSRRRPTAFAMIPPQFRDDNYWAESFDAGSTRI